jgi:hypothetical protein
MARTISATDVALDSLVSAPPSDVAPSADLSAALGALRETAGSLPADSARAWLVFAARRDSWSAGFGELRREAWPGVLGLVAFPPSDSADEPPTSSDVVASAALPRQAVVLASSPLEEEVLGAALEALGVTLVNRTSAFDEGITVLAFTAPLDGTLELAGALGRGATVLLGPSTHAVLPGMDPIWRPTEARRSGPHPLIRFRDGLIVNGVMTLPGRAASGARWLAATGDGDPAVVASSVGRGCLVTAAFDPMSLVEHAAAAMPDVLARMLRGCEADAPPPDGALPLDGGALEVLRGAPGGSLDALDGGESAGALDAGVPGLPPAVALEPLRDDAPGPLLVRGLILLALTAALVEAYLSYLHPRRRSEATAAVER